MTKSGEIPYIISDIDGVVANIVDRLCCVLYRSWDIFISPDQITEYSFGACLVNRLGHWELDVERSPGEVNEWLAEHFFHNHFFMRNLPPYWGLVRRLRDFASKRSLVFVSSRDLDLLPVTEYWLSHYGLLHKSPILTGDGYSEDRSCDAKLKAYLDTAKKPASQGRQVWILEDDPEMAKRLATHYAEDHKLRGCIEVLAPIRPWTHPIDCFHVGIITGQKLDDALEGK